MNEKPENKDFDLLKIVENIRKFNKALNAVDVRRDLERTLEWGTEEQKNVAREQLKGLRGI